MSAISTQTVASFDGAELAVHRMGGDDRGARPVMLVHGLFSDANTNWIRFGHAAKLAEAGFAVIMPDLRAHGESATPHDPQAYPQDVLVRDLFALVAALKLEDFDLAGFSLGARTSASAAVAGLKPRRLVLAGMGLDGLTGWRRRADFFIDAIDRFATIRHGDPAFFAVSFMKTQKVDLEAARLLLGSVGDVEPAALAQIRCPTLVLCGAEDRDNGDPHELVEALPEGRFAEVPGTHMSSVTEGAFGAELVAFLAG